MPLIVTSPTALSYIGGCIENMYTWTRVCLRMRMNATQNNFELMSVAWTKNVDWQSGLDTVRAQTVWTNRGTGITQIKW